MSPRRAVLCVSPHPDDELLGAPATLMALRDAGSRVINLACSLGRPQDAARRRRELTEACRLVGFELVIPEDLSPIGAGDDLQRAQPCLSDAILRTAQKAGAQLLVGPSPHDGHHGHEVVGRAMRDAVEAGGEPRQVIFWGLWSDLPLPNVFVGFDHGRLREIQHALGAHAGELARNRFDRLLEARAAAHALLGPERVFGFGVCAGEHPYAELLSDVGWAPERGWRLGPPRELDPAEPAVGWDGPEFGWWLHSPSVRSQVGGM